MPEIKHQFTGGKMNKDLDERLVPNGQYRDALNIQVSTSEDSEVGTVQNILGNSLVAGQDFLSEQAVCVGSIADEKNDKLYYFITQKNLLLNGNFDNNGSGWDVSTSSSYTGSQWTFSNNQAVGTDSDTGTMVAAAPGVVNGNRYTITYDIVVATIGGGLVLANHTTNASTLNSYAGSDNVVLIGEDTIGTYTVEWEQGSSRQNNIWLYNSNDYDGTIDNLSVFESSRARSLIVEYDSNTNTITPVLVDIFNDTLKFNQDNIITGISIIDDLLFWTDNENEPKKINIQRGIQGTDSSGIVHTDFINDKRADISNEPIREEHITVIKKAPKAAPTIELISERSNNLDKIYTGVMRITHSPIPPLEKGLDNLTNESSMWVHTASGFNHLHDFSSLKVGDQFDTQIETDISGNSGFHLDWKFGDELLFKEFSGDLYDEPPGLPITDYSIKCRINDWPLHNIFVDADSEVAQNGDFIIPNSNGSKPKYYSGNFSSTTFTYLPASNSIVTPVAGANDWAKIWSTPAQPFEADATYNARLELSNVTLNSVSLYIILEDPIDATKWYTFSQHGLTADVNEFTMDLDTVNNTSQNTNTNWQPYIGKFIIQTTGSSTTNLPFIGEINNISITKVNTENARVRCEVLEVNNPPTVPLTLSEIRFAVDRLDEKEKLFEFKFPRFAYRYQYEDREYSTMSPFSPIAFLPGSFDYHPKKGYNLGMTNRITSVNIKNFTTSVPDGVIAIDILYKDDLSSNIYIVDTIKPKHSALGGGSNIWEENGFLVTSEQISQMLPSNQLLRLWDAVPKKALAQDISGNRIIYGNYVQGFDLKAGDRNASEDYYPDFNFDIVPNTDTNKITNRSIKSLREYQLGVVFVDEYGRETPVISNVSGTKKLIKHDADKANMMRVSFNNNNFPENMKYFKFFIKETSGEYYNLAMDRYYDAEDGQIWLSFPSSDRNKLDIDTFLILKKGLESNDLVKEEAKYKVLDIQSEAPDFIKQSKVLVEAKTHVATTSTATNTPVFGSGLSDVPLMSNDTFKVNYDQFQSSSGSNLHKVEDDLYVEFTNTTNIASKRYRIAEITTDYEAGTGVVGAKYSIKLDKKFGEDINFISDSVNGLNPTKINNGTVINIYRYTKENSAKFDGRFFVKIDTDSIFNESINIASAEDVEYRTVLSKKLYYLSGDSRHRDIHSNALTGQNRGIYGDTSFRFHAYAPFFRNYKYGVAENPNNHGKANPYGTSGSANAEDIGQYIFGNTNNARKELQWITGGGGGGASNPPYFARAGNQIGATYSSNFPGVKVADSHGWTEAEQAGVYNSNGEQTAGDVWFIDGGRYDGASGGNSLNWGWINTDSGTSTGIQFAPDQSYIVIGLGGIHHSAEAFGTGTSHPGNEITIPSEGGDYFNITGNDGNPNYDTSGMRNMVERFYPGQKFRFREDPNKEIYTIQPTVHETQKLRWHDGSTSSPPWTHPTPVANQKWNRWKDTDGTWHRENPSGYNDYDRDSYFEDLSIQLSPNFSKNWAPRFKNSSGTGAIAWDPVGNGSPGPITDGMELGINHSVDVWVGTGQPYVQVDSLIATDKNTGLKHSITTGMILTSHSNGIGAGVFTGLVGGSHSYEELAIKEIEELPNKQFKLKLSGYRQILTDQTDNPVSGLKEHRIFSIKPVTNQELIFKQPKMNGYSQYSVNRINAQHPEYFGVVAIGYNLEFIEPIESEPLMPSNPAIWETEPKESTDLDIYYEVGGLNPLKLELDTKDITIPFGSIVKHIGGNYIEAGTTVTSFLLDGTDWVITLSTSSLAETPYILVGDELKITKPNGDIIVVTISGFGVIDANNRTSAFKINLNLYGDKTKYTLNWHNCYSFGNGVESNRIRDNFNLPFISNGVKVSTTLEEGFGEEHRKYGLIYSGIYNSNSSTNNLNQFIAAEKITKDVNPIYGSIQKLHSRDTDLVTLCEDKCLRILANKDAVFNADGNPNLTATDKVLGQTYTFSGEFGISKNPESFASESYRVYFTDKVRGTVMRLSKDGLTPISMHGMKDWFKDNLKLSTKLIGSHDDRKEEYNITLADRKTLGEELIVNGNFETDYTEWFGSKTHWYWDSVNKNLFSDGYAHARIGQYLPSPVTAGKSYEISWTVGEPQDGSALVGRLWVTLHDDSTNYKSIGGIGYGNPATVGTYTVTVTVDSNWGYWQYTEMLSSINFHNKETIQNDGIFFNGTIDNISVKEIISDPITVSFKEDVRGWVSFKSFVPESGVSTANDYYTMLGGKLYKHHIENTNRNNFYNTDYNSSVNVILNDGPGSIKSFHTLDYEGSQSKIDEFSIDTTTGLSDAQPYNLTPKDGWYVSGIETDKQVGNIHEFIEKEGKWFNYIKGIDSDITSETDFGAFDIQGIGILSSISSNVLTFDNNINTSLQIGDIIYFQTPNVNGVFNTIDSSNITKYGDVTAVTNDTITVNLIGSAPVADDYIMFAKNHVANTSSLVGYFADVKFENNSTDKIELFSVGSEITQSSK